MDDVLAACIDNFGEPPRSILIWDRLTYLRIPKPEWLRNNPDDPIKVIFEQLGHLYHEGFICWGHIIQANYRIFSEGPDDVPGELVYPYSNDERGDPESLNAIARQISALKNTEPDHPELAPIAHYLTDEHIRAFGIQVPKVISPNVPYRISTTLFARKHLPGGKLCRPFLPILVMPRKPFIVMPLPGRYWPEGFVKFWTVSGM